ncbi:carbonic anhydrase [Pontibaca methylaminivorans]|uniref:carbonic anhydrase n=1 Tax=Pontibaca methylaminivorans TaxID=515897 RepID=UPI002FD9C12B
MKYAKPLPGYLAQRYHGWKATAFKENEVWYRRLADDGQHPRAMIICCCDSRVEATQIFGADPGEFFVHRNIANLIPPYEVGGQQHGTSSTVEFAVKMLKVAHIVVMAHQHCGGAQGCIDMCEGNAPELESKDSFTGRWMEMLRPRYEQVAGIDDPEQKAREMEKQTVVVSLENLMTFPFVKEAVEQNGLSLHGLWINIGEGVLEGYDPATGQFAPV